MNKRSVFKRIVSAVLSLSMVLSYIDVGPLQKLTSLVMDAVADEPVPAAKEQGRAKYDLSSMRAYYYWRSSGTFGGVERKTYIHVYAKAGETIAFGSNVYNSCYLENGVDLQYTLASDNKTKEYDPDGYKDKDGNYIGFDIVMTDVNDRRISFDVKKKEIMEF